MPTLAGVVHWPKSFSPQQPTRPSACVIAVSDKAIGKASDKASGKASDEASIGAKRVRAESNVD